MSRQRLHYSKNQIINDLYTYGEEWMYEDTIEYVGPYHKYTTGEIYTEPNWNPKLSKKLITYQDTTSAKYRYKQINTFIKTKYKYVDTYSIIVKNADVINGYLMRYFIKKINDANISEINSKTYDDYNGTLIDPNLYIVISIKWYITGNVQTTTTNGITTIGVYEKNESVIRQAEKSMSGITAKLPDLLELYRDTGYTIPPDINNPNTVTVSNTNKALYVDAPVIDDILEKQKADEEAIKKLEAGQQTTGTGIDDTVIA